METQIIAEIEKALAYLDEINLRGDQILERNRLDLISQTLENLLTDLDAQGFLVLKPLTCEGFKTQKPLEDCQPVLCSLATTLNFIALGGAYVSV